TSWPRSPTSWWWPSPEAGPGTGRGGNADLAGPARGTAAGRRHHRAPRVDPNRQEPLATAAPGQRGVAAPVGGDSADGTGGAGQLRQAAEAAGPGRPGRARPALRHRGRWPPGRPDASVRHRLGISLDRFGGVLAGPTCDRARPGDVGARD